MMNPTSNSFRDTVIGSIFVTLGQLLFSTNSAMVKYSGLKEAQLLFGRFVIHTLIAICYWIVLRYKGSIPHKHWYGDKEHIHTIWIRGFTFTISMICWWYGIIRLPIGDAEGIFYQIPIVTAMLGWLFLKEELPKMTPLICILGIVGILCISQPQFLITSYDKLFLNVETDDVKPLNIDGVCAMLGAIFTWSITAILIRKAKDSHFLQLDIVAGVQSIFIMVPSVLLLNTYVLQNPFIGGLDLKDWVFDLKSAIIITFLGIFGFLGLTFSILGYQYADATKVAWLEYISLVYAFAYQIFFFGDIPNVFEVIGVVFVLLACCVSLLEEAYKHYSKRKVSYAPLNTVTTSDSGYDSELLIDEND
eukprot:133422_1